MSDDVDFKVIARKPFGLDLKPGVNLISIPGSPVGDSGNLNILFEDEPVDPGHHLRQVHGPGR